MRFLFIILMSFYFSVAGASIRSFGHNMSHTDYMIDSKSCVVGLQVIGCGNGNMTVGTSPFLYGFYNMHNLYFRYKVTNGFKFDNSIELAYFKTFDDDKIPDTENKDFLNQVYKMEALWLYHIISIDMVRGYKMHINTNFNYYFDDKRPFSLRRPTVKRKPYQLNLTTLHEIQMSKKMQLLGEFGVLHVLDTYPRIHMGSSFVYNNGTFLFQLGFTFTTTFNGLFVTSAEPNRLDFQQFLIYTEQGYDSQLTSQSSYIKQDFSIHPEIAIQYLF